jgi:hypothetical protein
MSHRSFFTVAIFASLVPVAGCGGVPVEPRPAPQLSSSVTARGAAVYVGTVFPLKAATDAPSFTYERRVDDAGRHLVSTHVTRDASGAIALAESATHAPDYRLSSYELHANQLGQRGSIVVENGRVHFRLIDEGGERTRVERQPGAVVVGPTLVGYIVRHLGELRASKVLEVRMAVLDRLETLGFELQAVEAKPGQTRVRMRASSFLVGLAVDPIHFTFETESGRLVRLEGRVPPKVRKGDRLHDFDARVEYHHVAAVYR